MNTRFMIAICVASAICGCARIESETTCRKTYDGPWQMQGRPIPSREDIASKLVGMTSSDASRYLGERTPYRDMRDRRKIFWYAERRRRYSEIVSNAKCAQEMLDQAYLFIEAQLDDNGVIVACSLKHREFLTRSAITPQDAERSPPGPLDVGELRCAK